jgi:hypothetical protein
LVPSASFQWNQAMPLTLCRSWFLLSIASDIATAWNDRRPVAFGKTERYRLQPEATRSRYSWTFLAAPQRKEYVPTSRIVGIPLNALGCFLLSKCSVGSHPQPGMKFIQ